MIKHMNLDKRPAKLRKGQRLYNYLWGNNPLSNDAHVFRILFYMDDKEFDMAIKDPYEDYCYDCGYETDEGFCVHCWHYHNIDTSKVKCEDSKCFIRKECEIKI